MKIGPIFLIVFCMILAFVGGLVINQSNIKRKNNIIEALGAEVTTWKDKDSLNHAKIQVIETSSAKEFTKLATNDSLVMELQSLVKDFSRQLRNSGSATIVKTVMQYDTVFLTTGVINLDSNKYGIELPYSRNHLNKWLDMTYTIQKDSTFFSLTSKNDYSVVIGEEKQSLFKKRPYVEVKNHNPYTSTEALRTYQVSVPKKKFGVGPQVGVTLSNDLSITPYLGVGVSYNLIRF